MARHTPLSWRERADLFTHLATLEKAGLPTDKAFNLLRLRRPAQPRLDQTRKLLARGANPAVAGEKSGLFTPLEARLLHAALGAGSPASTYRRLADTYTQKAMQLAAIKSRLVMPIFILVIALFVQPLPALVSGSLTGSGYLLRCLGPLIVIAGLAYLARHVSAWLERGGNNAAHALIDRLLLHIPIFGTLHERVNARNFFESLALLLEAGMPMFDALPIAVGTIHNSKMQQEFAYIKPGMERGATLAHAIAELRRRGDAQVIALIETGEASGTLPAMLLRHANAETDGINHVQQQLADWLPRIAYGLIMCWMIYGILTGSGMSSRLPPELR